MSPTPPRSEEAISRNLKRDDPQAWLADVLARIADQKITQLAEMLPWNWRQTRIDRAA